MRLASGREPGDDTERCERSSQQAGVVAGNAGEVAARSGTGVSPEDGAEMNEQQPDVDVSLWWDRDLRFRCQAGRWVTEIDGNSRWAPSPLQVMLESVAACAAVDVVEILRKGRQEIRELTVKANGTRRGESPRHFTELSIDFHITGDVDRDKAERAARLSFEKYCSAFHSLRRDLELDWTVRVEETAPGGNGKRGG